MIILFVGYVTGMKSVFFMFFMFKYGRGSVFFFFSMRVMKIYVNFFLSGMFLILVVGSVEMMFVIVTGISVMFMCNCLFLFLIFNVFYMFFFYSNFWMILIFFLLL